ACELLEADPAASVAIEDSQVGVASAVAAGLFTVAVPHALTASHDLSAADLVLATLEGTTLDDLAGMARRGAAAKGMAWLPPVGSRE
ncbi:MAG: hypothetical protein JWL70_2294, partial [Acidimicrobiia bacterium]|nr:hypothetical protein [Acidimicrobiia bacterium]